MKYFVFFLLILIPVVSLAQFYDPIVGVPGVDPKNSDFNVYINSIYALSIGLAALLAVIKIIIAGVKWMLTDVVTSKEEAKKDIKGALIGLLIILSAVLLISVINKDILDVNLTLKAQPTPTKFVSYPNQKVLINSIAGVSSNTSYSSLAIDSSLFSGNRGDVKAFKKSCAAAGKKSVITHDSTLKGTVYCYEVGPKGGANKEIICPSIGFNMCDPLKNNSQTAQMACADDYGGVWSIDPEDSSYGICIY